MATNFRDIFKLTFQFALQYNSNYRRVLMTESAMNVAYPITFKNFTKCGNNQTYHKQLNKYCK